MPEVVFRVHEVRKQGMGVISMKLAGEGTFDREDRRKAMRFSKAYETRVASAKLPHGETWTSASGLCCYAVNAQTLTSRA